MLIQKSDIFEYNHVIRSEYSFFSIGVLKNKLRQRWNFNNFLVDMDTWLNILLLTCSRVLEYKQFMAEQLRLWKNWSLELFKTGAIKYGSYDNKDFYFDWTGFSFDAELLQSDGRVELANQKAGYR